MQAQLNESKGQATALGRKGVDYAVLLREAESNRTIYNQLLTREKELRVVANSRTNNVRVVDKAQVAGRAVLAQSPPRLGLCGRARPGARPRRSRSASTTSTTPSRRRTTSRAG